MVKIKKANLEIETALLKNLSERAAYEKYIKYVDLQRVFPNTRTLLLDYEKYFTLYPSRTAIDWPELYTQFSQNWHTKDMEQQDIGYYREYVLPAIQAVPLTDTEKCLEGLIQKLHIEEIEKCVQAGMNVGKIRQIIDTYEKEMMLSGADDDKQAYTITSINFKDLDKNEGIPWFMPSLQRGLLSLTGGQFVGVSADFGTGKTAFVISQLAHTLRWAQRVGEKRPILYINSEGLACDVFGRMLSCLYRDKILGGFEEIVDRHAEVVEKYSATFNPAQVMVFQMSDVSNFQAVQNKMTRYNPCLVIIDICDKLAPEEDVQSLKKLYDNLRVQSGMGCPIIGCTQSGNTSYFDPDKKEVKNKKWLDDHSLYGSITGKGGAFDTLITIGREDSTSNLRYINVAKKKRGEAVRITAELIDKYSFYKELTL